MRLRIEDDLPEDLVSLIDAMVDYARGNPSDMAEFLDAQGNDLTIFLPSTKVFYTINADRGQPIKAPLWRRMLRVA